VDDTGAVLQALSAAGMDSDRAVGYLRGLQNADGGFGQMDGRDSNAQSTAWAVQGLVAKGVRPESVGADPIRYLGRLQRSDGHIAYSRTSDQTPVWVTAQALTALRKKPFPLAAVPRVTEPSPGRTPKRRASATEETKARSATTEVRDGRAKRKAERRAPATATPAEQPARIDPEPTSGEPAAAEGERSLSAGLIAAGAAVLVLVGALRRRLRSRRPRPG